MSKRPYLPFFTDDWLGSSAVRMMTFEQRGIYIELLLFCWKDGSIPKNNAEILKLIAAKPHFNSKKLKPVLDCFYEDSDRLRHKKIDELLQKTKLTSQKRRDAANARWEKPAMQMHSKCIANAMHSRARNSDSFTDTDKNKYKDRKDYCSKFDEQHIELARFLWRKIKANNPKAKEPTKSHGHKWADTFRKMEKIDGHSIGDIRRVIEWSQNDDFWSTNILSADKLRKQWNTLTAQMNASLGAGKQIRRKQHNMKALDEFVGKDD